MFINDIFEDIPPGARTEQDDNSVQKMNELRKTRLTLAQIRRLRLMNDLRKYEEQQKVEAVSKQYKTAAPAPAM